MYRGFQEQVQKSRGKRAIGFKPLGFYSGIAKADKNSWHVVKKIRMRVRPTADVVKQTELLIA